MLIKVVCLRNVALRRLSQQKVEPLCKDGKLSLIFKENVSFEKFMHAMNAYNFCLASLKRQTKIAADDTLFFYFYPSKEIRMFHMNPLPSRRFT